MHLSASSSLEKLNSSNKLFLELFNHGTLNVEVYKPVKEDLQKPHNRDEVYVIISGSGEFINGGKAISFQPGDFLFVAASVEHRFINFTEDFSTWVLFYGPRGGESSIR
jgi:mannose-6-phosphate isomerase-like protein (cupin superfamily)